MNPSHKAQYESVMSEILSKYGEWLEHAGDRAPALHIDILTNLLIKEREKSEHYKLVASKNANGSR